MKRLIVIARTTAGLITLAAIMAGSSITAGPTAYAFIACPLESAQPISNSCGCNPRIETPEPDTAIKCYPCPYVGSSVQPQSVVCACPTYCRADNGTTSVSTSGSSNPSLPGSTTGQVVPLTSGQLAACQKAAPKITAIIARMANRGQNQLTTFSAIATRAEHFYASSGRTFAGYDALLTATNSTEQAAQAQVNTLKQEAAAGIDCGASNPRSIAVSYAANAKAEIAALQTYRTAVKNLIIGIQSAEGTT